MSTPTLTLDYSVRTERGAALGARGDAGRFVWGLFRDLLYPSQRQQWLRLQHARDGKQTAHGRKSGLWGSIIHRT